MVDERLGEDTFFSKASPTIAVCRPLWHDKKDNNIILTITFNKQFRQQSVLCLNVPKTIHLKRLNMLKLIRFLDDRFIATLKIMLHYTANKWRKN